MKVSFMDYLAAKALIPADNEAMICITSPDSILTAEEGWKHCTTVIFEDVENSSNPNRFNLAQARQIYGFLENLPAEVQTIHVHCFAGISRSAAVAKYIAHRYEIEDYIVKIDKYPHANKLVFNTLKQYCPVVGDSSKG